MHKWELNISAHDAINRLRKESLNSNGKQFHQYQQNEQSSLTLRSWLLTGTTMWRGTILHLFRFPHIVTYISFLNDMWNSHIAMLMYVLTRINFKQFVDFQACGFGYVLVWVDYGSWAINVTVMTPLNCAPVPVMVSIIFRLSRASVDIAD